MKEIKCADRVWLAGFGEGAPESEQLLEAAARLSKEGTPKWGPLTSRWSIDRSLIVLENKKGWPVMIINPNDFVKLGGVLPK